MENGLKMEHLNEAGGASQPDSTYRAGADQHGRLRSAAALVARAILPGHGLLS